MRVRRRVDQDGDAIPMSAMIDVVFLLLIFFIVTHADPLIEAHCNIKDGAAAPPDSTIPAPLPPLMTLLVLPSGYVVNAGGPGQQITLLQFDDYLQRMGRYNRSSRILFKIAPDASHGQVVSAMDLCRKNHFDNLQVTCLRP